MGCGSSKKKSARQVRKIKSEMPKCAIPKFDEFFESASKVLKAAEELREPLQDCMEFMVEACDVDALTSKPKSELLEAFKVWLWSVSACNDGKLANCKIEFSEKEPYIIVDESKIGIDQADFTDNMKKWKDTIVKAPKEVEELIKQCEEFATKSSELITTVVDDCKAANLGIGETITAGKNASKCAGRLGKGLKKLKEMPNLIKEAVTAMVLLAKELPAEIKKADEMGAKALAEKLRNP